MLSSSSKMKSTKARNTASKPSTGKENKKRHKLKAASAAKDGKKPTRPPSHVLRPVDFSDVLSSDSDSSFADGEKPAAKSTSGKARILSSKLSVKEMAKHHLKLSPLKERNILGSIHDHKSSRSTQPQKGLLKALSFNDILSSDSDTDISGRGNPCPIVDQAKAILQVDSASDDGSLSGEDAFISCIDESILDEPKQSPSTNGRGTNVLPGSLDKPQNLMQLDSINAMCNETILKSRVSMASVNLDLESFGEPLVESTRIYSRSSTSFDQLSSFSSTFNASSDTSSYVNNTEKDDDDSYKQLNIHPQACPVQNTGKEVKSNILTDVDLCSSMNYLNLKPVDINKVHEKQRILLSVSDENISLDCGEGSFGVNVDKTEVSHDETKYTTALEKLDECPNNVHDRARKFKMKDGTYDISNSFESNGSRHHEDSNESFECVEVVDVAVQTDNETASATRKEILHKQKTRAAAYNDETTVRSEDESVETVGKSEASLYENETTELNISVDESAANSTALQDFKNNEQKIADIGGSGCDDDHDLNDTTVSMDTANYTKETVADTDKHPFDEPTVHDDDIDSFGCEQQATDVDEPSHCDKQPVFNETTVESDKGNYTKETVADTDKSQFNQSTVSNDTDSMSGGLFCQPIYNQLTVDLSESLSSSTEPVNDSVNSFSESSHTSAKSPSNENALVCEDLESDGNVSDGSVCEVVDVATQTDRSYQSKNDDAEDEKHAKEPISAAYESSSLVVGESLCDQQMKEISNNHLEEGLEASGSGYQSSGSSSGEIGVSEASCSADVSRESGITGPLTTFTAVAESVDKGHAKGMETKKSNITDRSWRDSRQFSSDSSDDEDLENFFQKMRKPAKEISESPSSSPASMKDFIVEDDEISSDDDDDDAFHIRHTQYLENTPLTQRLTTTQKTQLPVDDDDGDDFSSKKFPSSVTKHKKRHQKNSKRRSWCFSSDSDDDQLSAAAADSGGKRHEEREPSGKNQDRKPSGRKPESLQKPKKGCSGGQVFDNEELDAPLFKTPNFIRKKTKTNTDSIKRPIMKPTSALPNVSISDSDESDNEVFLSASSSPSSNNENISSESLNGIQENDSAFFNKLPTPLVKGRQAKIATPQSSRGSRGYNFLQSLSNTVEDSRRHPEAVRYVNGFKKTREELAQRLYTLYNTTIFEGKLPEDLPILYNTRLLKTAGYCEYKRDKKLQDNRKVRIQLSTKVCDSAERVRDTLIHELCHAAVWLLNGINGGHGRIWKLWALLANKIHPELPVIKRCHSYNINTKFTYRCTTCGSSVGRHSKSLDIEKKICARCHGKFELLVNYATPSSTAGSSRGSSLAATPATPRTPNRFALFVKDHYSVVKKTRADLKHGDIMKELSRQFAESKISV